MWRRSFCFSICLRHCRRSITTTPTQSPPSSLYSFLNPTLFSNPTPPPPPLPSPSSPSPLSPQHKSDLITTLTASLFTNDTDSAWKSFKSLTHHNHFPSKPLANSLIAHLCTTHNNHHPLNLKRAFACVVYLIEKNPSLIDDATLKLVLGFMGKGSSPKPAFALVRCLFKNRVFVPFDVWGDTLYGISKRNDCFAAFLGVFVENCRVALEEGVEGLSPGLGGFNAALEGCCLGTESAEDADRVLELMSRLGVRPDEGSFGYLRYLYAVKGMEGKIVELEDLMRGFELRDDEILVLGSLVRGYAKSGDLESMSRTILRAVKERDDCGGSWFGDEIYCEAVKGFLKNGNVKDLARLIVEAQGVESQQSVSAAERTVGFGIVSACVNLGMLDKAYYILDEINACGGKAGLGVYLSILNACIKEQRTAEAAQMVADVSNLGLQLDAGCYDSLIEASMSCLDFPSAFSLFRDMREGTLSDLKPSYLTIMTGLTENNRPELMAAFLDEVVQDTRIEVGTHDWNSIIHAFCKAGRLEDARRTFRRMMFLQFEPNAQTYLSLINGYVTGEKYFSVLMLWNEVRKRDGFKGFKLDNGLVDAFLYALVKGGFFDAGMQVVEKSQELKIFVDKWRYKQAYMENHKKLKVSKLRRRNFRKMEAVIAFKNWAGLNA